MSPKRVLELKEKLTASTGGLIYVSAFANIKEFKRYAQDIAWDTEVWLADAPDHLMHFNGDRFLGPREQKKRSTRTVRRRAQRKKGRPSH